MVVVSYSGKEINAKLVYYGAGLSGKTTNLESIYEAVPESSRGKMVSMKTQSDRTLFFDLLPLDLGEIMGFKTRFLLYTVPGQVFYNATRKLVLKGADAIVLVADSEVGKMDENKESLANLRANLIEYDLKLEDIPWVLQYNKRDLANVYSIEELNAELNPGGQVPYFEAVATQGKGVFETFRGISHLLMEKVTRELRRAPTSVNRAPRADESPARPAAPAAPARPAVPSSPAIPSAPATFSSPAAPPAPAVSSAPAAPPTPSIPVSASASSAAGPSVTPPHAPTPDQPARPASTPVAADNGDRRPPTERPASPEIQRGFASGPMRPQDQGVPYQYGRELALDPSASSRSEDSAPSPTAGHPNVAPIEAQSARSTPVDSHPFASSMPTPPSSPRVDVERHAPVATLDTTRTLEHETESTPARPSVGLARHAEVAAESTPDSSGPVELTVPVTLPRGASREIVLRIVITNDPA